MEKVFLTGAEGYIGQNIDTLLNFHGYEVIWFDSNSYPQQDIRAYGTILEAAQGCQHFIHLAAISGIQKCEDDSLHAQDVNVYGTLNVLEAAEAVNAKSFVFASSLAAATADSVYGMTKHRAEHYLDRFRSLRTYKLRLANVYGGANFMSKHTVVANYLRALRYGGKAYIYGTGFQMRDFVHVYDVCMAVLTCVQSSVGNTDPIDICSGEHTTIRALASYFGVETETIQAKSERTSTLPSFFAAKMILGWQAKRKIKDEVERWLRTQKQVNAE